MHGLDNAGNACVVFVVGFRVLTSDSRRAIKRLSERLGITPMPVESMIDQFGKTAGNEFIRYLERPDEAHLQNAAQVLLIWQVCIVDGSEENLHTWHRLLRKARLGAPITERKFVWCSALCARWSPTRRS